MKINKGIKFQDDPEYRKIQDQRIELKADRARTQTQKGLDDLLFGSGAVRRKPRQPAQNAPTPAPTQPTSSQVTKQPSLPPIQQKKQQPKPAPAPQQPVKKIVAEQAPKPTSGRHGYNRPSYIRKLKKIAQNFNFESNNQTNHTYSDIVRPFQTERKSVLANQQVNTGSDGYNDRDFPASSISVGSNYRKQNIEWKKAAEFSNRAAFGKYVQPNDILVGQLSCPSFVSVLSCLAQRQKNIKRLIENQQLNPNGFYYVRLNINSVWRYISVDDLLPTLNSDNIGLLSFKDSQSEISLSLIEKAYAKAFGGYDVFQRKIRPQDYLRDLTGARVSRFALNNTNLVENIRFSLDQNWTVVAVPNSRIQELGLNNRYNLSVIGFGSGGFELRNSWGTNVQRSKINFSKQGVFNLTMQQASKYIDYILVAETDDKYHTSTVQSKHLNGFYSSYTFKVKSNVQGIISASQWDQRLFPKEHSYVYAPFRLILDKKGENKSEYIAGGYSHSDRNLDLLVTLTPGVYTVSCIGSWVKGNAYDYSFTFYGNHPVTFTKNYTQYLPNIIIESLQTFNLQNGKRSAKGHVDQYILYHEPTNLVLLTNLNVSQKPYEYTQDLSRINYETLNLLNSPNHEQNFGDKLYNQVSSIKEDHNNQRRWTVKLAPKEAYTWVISTRQNYNANNFKVWGFR